MEEDKAPDPAYVGFFSSEAKVFDTCDRYDLVE
jgi:hypothetical protein